MLTPVVPMLVKKKEVLIRQTNPQYPNGGLSEPRIGGLPHRILHHERRTLLGRPQKGGERRVFNTFGKPTHGYFLLTRIPKTDICYPLFPDWMKKWSGIPEAKK